MGSSCGPFQPFGLCRGSGEDTRFPWPYERRSMAVRPWLYARLPKRHRNNRHASRKALVGTRIGLSLAPPMLVIPSLQRGIHRIRCSHLCWTMRKVQSWLPRSKMPVVWCHSRVIRTRQHLHRRRRRKRLKVRARALRNPKGKAAATERVRPALEAERGLGRSRPGARARPRAHQALLTPCHWAGSSIGSPSRITASRTQSGQKSTSAKTRWRNRPTQRLKASPPPQRTRSLCLSVCSSRNLRLRWRHLLRGERRWRRNR
mmetsp:Transcript_113810/g.321884  ORF Transcript_113810/g.321884 Transcript_113810/m.321884 type:complete len:260 (-) Transcript_113810:1514-2293(-)